MSGVELKAVSKRYGQVVAVEDVDLSIQEGVFFSVLGPSGCGKTTTLRMIAGFIRPTAGKIFLDGREVTDLPPEKRDMGMVFQNYAIFPHMSIYDNIAFGLKMRRVSKDSIRGQVTAALRQVGLTGYEGRYARELSGGEQQRVALARVLVVQPKVLLLDEPLSALDKQLREEMQFWIKELQRNLGITTIYVTHDQVEAMTVSDQMVVMNKGHIDQMGTPREIYENPKTKFVATFIGESNVFEGAVSQVDGVTMAVQSDGVQLVAQKKPETAAGQRVTVIVRPEKITLSKAGPPDRSASVNTLEGTVVDRVYRGAQVRYTVRLAQEKRLIVDSQRTSEHITLELGEHVRLTWTPSDASVLLG